MDKNHGFLDRFIESATYGETDDAYIAYDGAKKTLISFLFLYAINKQLELANFNNTNDYIKLHNYLNEIFSSQNIDDKVLEGIYSLFEKNFGLPHGILEIEKLKEYLNHLIIFNESVNLHPLPPVVDYVSLLADLISRPQDSRDSANTYLHYTNESLQHLIAGILKVQNNETFMDCCCGMFSSALYNDAANYIGVELDKEIAGIAAMILIMSQKKFNIKHENFVEFKEENIADKILADIPSGSGIPQMENRPYGKNIEAYCIENVVKALKDGGKAVVVCFGSILSKQDSSKKLREAFTKDHLKAVIALPPMSNGIKSNTNLIILQKNCHAKEIKFINASNLKIVNKKRMTLNETDISDIIGCLNGEKTKCLFKDIPVEDILNSDSISWTPNNYVKGEEKSKGRSVEEIDKDLKDSYKELRDLFLD